MEEFSAFVGLSRPTVSKFFNDPSTLKETTRRRIEEALAASGFNRNLLAANLGRSRSSIVGVIVPDTADPFYAALTRRVQGMAQDAGFQAFVLSSDGDMAKEAQAVRTLSSMNVAGAVVAPLEAEADGSSDALGRLETDIPLVYVDSAPAGPAAFVGTDNRRSFDLIVAHLLASGTPPVFLGMPAVNANATARRKAYDAAMRAQGLEPQHMPLPATGGWDFERFGHEAMEMAIAEDRAAGRTVLCANDRLAFGALAAAWGAGLRVGGEAGCDLRIAGHDDHPLSRYTCPPLTTVAQDFDEIGRRAIEILLRRMNEGAPDDPSEDVVLLGAAVVQRRSA
ncbi:LacI family DNA-binding transcriptional regulator [Aureimonas sp. SK2]|uniref:LacI family DNA-binding transcriptional regulator n=1 Tax=Aureimonas sp. SK2 TaxID=3015992 RepID=UPI0024451439|nr:LacI family DNA-binding transcriptional regulator [Aureimonas sp. SK2]